MAPEILLGKPYDDKSDLWSVGCILYEMLVGVSPFRALNIVDLMKLIETRTITFPDSLECSEAVRQLITALLQKDPIKRIEWDDLFAHQWLVAVKPPAPVCSPPTPSLSKHEFLRVRDRANIILDYADTYIKAGGRHNVEGFVLVLKGLSVLMLAIEFCQRWDGDASDIDVGGRACEALYAKYAFS
jgi:serine/threonine protein kinase